MRLFRLQIATFFVGHGLVHGIMFSLPYSAQASANLPYNPSHSWSIGDAPSFGFAFALVATVSFVIAGGAHLGRASWWPTATIAAGGLPVALLAV